MDEQGSSSKPQDQPPAPKVVDGIEEIEGRDITILFDGKKCIHSRYCVTRGPDVFLANVQGPWIQPNAMSADRLAEIAHLCPSGAIRYRRKNGKPEESAPPVNLIAIRECGPYAVRADIRIQGEPAQFRATLCRCGASKNKPYCDGSHHDIGFQATGEAPAARTDMLPVRNGPLAIEPQPDGPLKVTGNVEITGGSGRVVSRVTQTWLCRCGASANKPFCDGTHKKVGFKA
jgi:CDGSH-type Zn-finger protein